jgi:hypothetical protein
LARFDGRAELGAAAAAGDATAHLSLSSCSTPPPDHSTSTSTPPGPSTAWPLGRLRAFAQSASLHRHVLIASPPPWRHPPQPRRPHPHPSFSWPGRFKLADQGIRHLLRVAAAVSSVWHPPCRRLSLRAGRHCRYIAVTDGAPITRARPKPMRSDPGAGRLAVVIGLLYAYTGTTCAYVLHHAGSQPEGPCPHTPRSLSRGLGLSCLHYPQPSLDVYVSSERVFMSLAIQRSIARSQLLAAGALASLALLAAASSTALDTRRHYELFILFVFCSLVCPKVVNRVR